MSNVYTRRGKSLLKGVFAQRSGGVVWRRLPPHSNVFGPGRFAPGTLFGLNVRVSKTAAAPIVVDASAFGRLYASPVALATFEENAGKTNSSLVRFEGNAVFGVERQTAAVRIAAS
jgi:hypothetical protein